MNNRKTGADIDIRDAFFDELYEIAQKDRDVIFLTADMGAQSLERFKRDLPAQYLNVGIAEQNLVSVAAGLALSGKNVFVYAIAPFITQRCYEQVRIDLCEMNLPVTVVGSGPGLTYGSDGPTHHAVEDIAIMKMLPNMTLLSPCDAPSTAAAARMAAGSTGPVYVRLDKGSPPPVHDDMTDFSQGLLPVKEGRDLLIIATGIMVHRAVALAEALSKRGIEAGVADLYRIKPLNEALLLKILRAHDRVVTLEEHLITGGIGSSLCELIMDHGITLSLTRCGLEELPCGLYGSRDWMQTRQELDLQHLSDRFCQTDKERRA